MILILMNDCAFGLEPPTPDSAVFTVTTVSLSTDPSSTCALDRSYILVHSIACIVCILSKWSRKLHMTTGELAQMVERSLSM